MAGHMALSPAGVAVDDAAREDALEALVREHARFVFKVAMAVLRNHHDAEDAVQETFLRVMRHRGELGGVRDARAWLARITWRIAVDRRKAPAAPPQQDMELTLQHARSPQPGGEQTVISTQMLEIAERLVEQLPRDLREVLTLSTVEEMTGAEVAAVLGIPEASVRSRLFRARQLLKNKMNAWLEGNAV